MDISLNASLPTLAPRRCWRTSLAALTALIDPPLATPLALFTATPSEGGSRLPSNLPMSTTLRAIYDIFDGGFLGGYQIFSCEELSQENELLSMLPRVSIGRHPLLGTHPQGAPLIWDAHADVVSTLHRDGDLRTLAPSLTAFFDDLFNPSEGQVIWFEALTLLEEIWS